MNENYNEINDLVEDCELDDSPNTTLEGEAYYIVRLEIPTFGICIDKIAIVDMDYWKDPNAYQENREMKHILHESNEFDMIILMEYNPHADEYDYTPTHISSSTKENIQKKMHKFGYDSTKLATYLTEPNVEFGYDTISMKSNIFKDIENGVTKDIMRNKEGMIVPFIDVAGYYIKDFPDSFGKDFMHRIIHKFSYGNNHKVIVVTLIFEGAFSGVYTFYHDPNICGLKLPLKELQNNALKNFHMGESSHTEPFTGTLPEPPPLDLDELDLRNMPEADLRKENDRLRRELAKKDREIDSYVHKCSGCSCNWDDEYTMGGGERVHDDGGWQGGA